jgi:exopolysaccharide/PEP-CTERM locus tyrosine autokinase
MSIIEKALEKQRESRPPARPREQVISFAEPSKKRRLPRESIELSLDALCAEGIVPVQESHRLAEQFRRIKWPVLEPAIERRSSPEATAANVVMIASSIPGEGKTFTSFNLGLSIAREKDFSVLLIDADVAKRHLTRVLKAEERPGLTDAVADTHVDPEDFVLGTGVPGLSFLPAGRRTSIAPELFASQRMADIVTALGSVDKQRIALFDSSPLLATDESHLLARLVGQVVLVVRAESTSQQVVLEAIQFLDRSKQIRCILNQASVSGLLEYYYGYGYSSNDRPKE